ncbi:MAG TPA: PKD domain-containing protein, partial [Flavobacteriales bacterium]|nr:PKD domain-containing protein [Flavobacteriales bacterium]
ESYCGANDGSINITTAGGTPPYQYSIDCANFSSNNTFTGLSAGTYTICVTDTFGCQGTDTITISCPPAGCQASFTYTVDTNTCSVSFNNTSTGAFSYFWDFGDGNTSALTSPTHPYNSSGSYLIWLNAYDSLGILCDSTYQQIYINCSNPCNLNVSITGWDADCSSGLPYGGANATVSGSSPPYTYLWSNGNTGPTMAALPGTYTLIVYDATGCSDTGTVTISDATTISLQSSVSNETYCGANDGSFTIVAQGGAPNYQYSIDCVNFSSNSTFTGLSAGTYTICVTDTFGCQGTDSVTIYCPPAGCQASFTPIWDTISLCTVSFQNNSTGASYYLWNFGDGNTSNQMNPQYTWSATGVYNVVLYAYDSLQNLCDSASYIITTSCSNPTGIIVKTAEKEITASPNPTLDKLHIDLGKIYEDVSLKMYSITGQQVLSSAYGNQQHLTLNLKDFAPGVYLAHIQTPESTEVLRVVKGK